MFYLANPCCIIITLVVCTVTGNNNPSLDKKTATIPEIDVTIAPNQLTGTFYNPKGIITFKARIDGDNIYSTTSFNSKEISFDTSLSFPQTNQAHVPRLPELIVTAAKQLSTETDCLIPPKMSELYEAFSEALYQYTKSLGASQLRFSLMYHVSIIGTSKRVCQHNNKPLCTPSPTYTLGEELFVCVEDLEDIFPQDKEMMMPSQDELMLHSGYRQKRGCLKGSQKCCCGNYPGCCVFSHVLCCIHDRICNCCGRWYCGFQCKPANGC